jgi:hypothetical protein
MTNPTKLLHSIIPGHVPPTLLSGQLAINEADRALYYLDPNLAAPASLLDQIGVLAQGANLIINGLMEVDQIHNGALQSSFVNGYAIDTIKVITGGAQVISCQQITDAPPGLVKSLKVAVTTPNTSPGSTDFCAFQMLIEGRNSARLGFGAVGALGAAVGFYVKAFRAGTYGVNISNGANNRGYSAAFTIAASATWQWVTVAIPGDITGTWAADNTLGMIVSIFIMAGSSLQMTPNSWTAGGYQGVQGMTNGTLTVNDFMQITGVCVFPGYVIPTAVRTPAMHPRFAEALVLCSRYWQKSYDYETAPGAVTPNGAQSFWYTNSVAGQFSAGVSVHLKVPQAMVPAVTTFSPITGTSGKVRSGGADNADVTSTLFFVGQKSFAARATLVGAADGRADLSFHWTADARL